MALPSSRANLITPFLLTCLLCRLHLRLPEPTIPLFELLLLPDHLLPVKYHEPFWSLVLGPGLDLGRPLLRLYVSLYFFFLPTQENLYTAHSPISSTGHTFPYTFSAMIWSWFWFYFDSYVLGLQPINLIQFGMTMFSTSRLFFFDQLFSQLC